MSSQQEKPGVLVLVDAENQSVEWTKKALDKAKELGVVAEVRAFGDFRTTDNRYADLCIEEGIHCEQVFSIPRKNASDIHLCMYAVERLSDDDWGTLVLVSGDGDFLPLVQHMHRKKKRVIGVAKKVNNRLARACDEFVCEPRATLTIIDAIVSILGAREDKTMSLADLGNALKQRNSSLIPLNFGFKSLTEVIESDPQRLRVVSGYKTVKCVVGLV